MAGSHDYRERFESIRRLRLNPLRRRVPVIRQLQLNDCGAAALAMVLGYHDRHVAVDELRQAIGTGRAGSTVASLIRVGRAYGLRSRGVHAEVEDLRFLPAGTILYWEFRHYLVFERVTRNGVDVVDPAIGRRSVSMEAFRRGFTGVALIFEPTETFEPGRASKGRIAGLFMQLLDQRDLLVRIVGISLLSQILSVAMPIFTGILIDRVVPRRDYTLLLVLALGFCVFQLSNVVAGFIRAHLLIHLRSKLEISFTLRFLDHLMELPYSFFQHRTSGDLMVRLGSNNAIKESLTSVTLSAIMDGSLASLYLILLLLTSGPLAVSVFALAFARMLLLAVMRWRQRQLLAESLENQSRSQTSQVEMLSGIEALKAMGLEHKAAENWSNVFIDGLNISIRRGRLDAVFTALLSILGAISTFVLMFYGMFLVIRGNLTLGSMMAFNALAAGFLGPLNNLVSTVLQLQMVEVYLDRLNDVMQTPPEQDPAAVTAAPELTGAVTFENVSFRYSPQEPLVLDGATVEIKAGSRVAVAGRTGSGKSTLARLIAGLYDPVSGRILFDGIDFKALDRRSVRCQLGIVTQDTHLFSGSLRRNIALSDSRMGLERVIRAAKVACIHDDIVAMPMGYDTPLSDRGLTLSGGQRQRLAIARAVASEPRILILDEATSHLDAATEENVNRNIAALRCTRIVIAHRLSTIRDADLILVLEKGRIVESGDHDELSQLNGRYSRLLGNQREGPYEKPARVIRA